MPASASAVLEDRAALKIPNYSALVANSFKIRRSVHILHIYVCVCVAQF